MYLKEAIKHKYIQFVWIQLTQYSIRMIISGPLATNDTLQPTSLMGLRVPPGANLGHVSLQLGPAWCAFVLSHLASLLLLHLFVFYHSQFCSAFLGASQKMSCSRWCRTWNWPPFLHIKSPSPPAPLTSSWTRPLHPATRSPVAPCPGGDHQSDRVLWRIFSLQGHSFHKQILCDLRTHGRTGGMTKAALMWILLEIQATEGQAGAGSVGTVTSWFLFYLLLGGWSKSHVSSYGLFFFT